MSYKVKRNQPKEKSEDSYSVDREEKEDDFYDTDKI